MTENAAKFAGKVHFCDYADLVTHPKEEPVKIGKFLDVDLSGVDPTQPVPTLRSANDESASALDGEPVSNSRIGNLDGMRPEIMSFLDRKRGQIANMTGFDPFGANRRIPERRRGAA